MKNRPERAHACAGGVLPDVLQGGLDIVFCGTAAGAVSAAKGAYYAGPGNAFWPTLFEVGLTPYAVQSTDYASLPRWKMGLTDLAKHVSGGDCVLARCHFDVARLHGALSRYSPRWLAFTGKRAAAEFMGGPVHYGMQHEAAGTTRIFVLPSPSGAARRHWSISYWQQLADLRAAQG